MRRITTPTHTFIFDTNPQTFTAFRITYKQNGATVLEKTEADREQMEVTQAGDKYVLAYNLTQEETAKFTPNSQAKVQVRAKLEDGTVVASEVFAFAVADVFNQEILA